MSNNSTTPSAFPPRRLTVRILAPLCLICLLPLLALKLYLASPLAAPQLSRLLSARLHQPVSVARLDLTGITLSLYGLTIANPPGFPAGTLATAAAVRLTPEAGALLGRPHFRLVALEGVRLHLSKNGAGSWNFSPLQAALAPKAGPRRQRELKIGRFTLADGSLQVHGRGVGGLAITLHDLSSRGTSDSRMALSFEDSGRNRYRIAGTARGGDDPAFDLQLDAPRLALKGLAPLLRLPETLTGTAALQLQAALHQGLVTARGRLEVADLPPLAGTDSPARLELAASYRISEDLLQVERLSLEAGQRLRLQAGGSVARLRSARRYAATVQVGRADLGLVSLLPQVRRRSLTLAGQLSTDSVQVSGSAGRGIDSLTGTIRLEGGSVMDTRRVLARRLTGSLTLLKTAAGFDGRGRLRAMGDQPGDMLQQLDAPLSITLSPALRPQGARIAPLSARIGGIPLTGEVRFDAGASEPYAVSLRVPATSAAGLNRVMPKESLRFSAGTLAASLEGTARDLRNLRGRLRVQLKDLHGLQGERRLTVREGNAAATLERAGGRFSADGAVQLAGLSLGVGQGEAGFDYRYDAGSLVVSNGRFSSGPLAVRLARLTARLPDLPMHGSPSRWPVEAELTGGSIVRGPLALEGLAGSLRGSYLTEGPRRWLEGSLGLTARQAAWQGSVLAVPILDCTFQRGGAIGMLGGTLLGGALSGEIQLDPFTPAGGSTFRLQVRDGQLNRAAGLFPRSWRITPSGGLVQVDLQGSLGRDSGLDSRFSLQGRQIALARSDGRGGVAGAGLELAGRLTGRQLLIEKGVVTAGEAVRLNLRGDMTDMTSPQRRGQVVFDLPQLPLGSLIDPFAGILPRFLQEATTGGEVAARGQLDLHDGQRLISGYARFDGVRLSTPDGRFALTGIEGGLPFSFALTPVPAAVERPAVAFSHEHYPRLLMVLHQASAGAPSLRVARLEAGPVRVEGMALKVSAADGFTRLDAISLPLYGGSILGQGTLSLHNGLAFRSDLLISSLSLKRLCAEFPGITGYMSGLVDGIVSLSGTGSGGKEGLTGFLDLWAGRSDEEEMLISKEFLQRLANKKLSGFFFRNDRPYDRAEIKATLERGFLGFQALDIVHTNLLGVRDLSVSIAPSQNRIALEHLLGTIGEAASRGRPTGAGSAPAREKPVETPLDLEFKWQE